MHTYLTPADRERLAKLASLLASDKGGEVIAAAAAVTRFLKQRDVTWYDVIGIADQPAPAVRHNWRDMVRECRAQPGCLRQWERGFLRDLESFPHISSKQRNILYEIAERLGLRRAAA